MKFQAGKFTLLSGTYTSIRTGLVQSGGVVIDSWALKKWLPNSFEAELLPEERDMSLRLEGGLGDKIYFLPLLNVLSEEIGAEPRDYPLFRCVKSKPRPPKKEDVPISMFLEQTFDKELTDQFMESLGVFPSLKVPVLETTKEEKAFATILEKYIVVCQKSSNLARDLLPEGVIRYLEERLQIRVIELMPRSLPQMMAVIEKAEAVLSVSTSAIPLAIGLQVPVVGCNVRMCRNRVKYSVEAYVCDPYIDEISSLLEDILSCRFKCWCGESDGVSVIGDNLWMIKCKKCGTLRQDIKVTPSAFKRFLKTDGRAWAEDYVGVVSSKKSSDFSTLFAKVLNIKDVFSWLDVGSGVGCIKDVVPLYIKLTTVDIDGGSDYREVSQVNRLFDVVSMLNVIHFIDLYEDFSFILSTLKKRGLLVVRGFVKQPSRYARFRYLFPLKEAWLLKFLAFYKFSVLYSSIEGEELTVIAKRS